MTPGQVKQKRPSDVSGLSQVFVLWAHSNTCIYWAKIMPNPLTLRLPNLFWFFFGGGGSPPKSISSPREKRRRKLNYISLRLVPPPSPFFLLSWWAFFPPFPVSGQQAVARPVRPSGRRGPALTPLSGLACQACFVTAKNNMRKLIAHSNFEKRNREHAFPLCSSGGISNMLVPNMFARGHDSDGSFNPRGKIHFPLKKEVISSATIRTFDLFPLCDYAKKGKQGNDDGLRGSL